MKNRKHKWVLILQLVLIFILAMGSVSNLTVPVKARYRVHSHRLVSVRKHSYKRYIYHTQNYYLRRIKHEERSLRYLIRQLQVFYHKRQRNNYYHQRAKYQYVKQAYLKDRYHRRYRSITHMDHYQYDRAIHLLVKHYSHTERQARNEAFWDINRDRAKYHLPKLTVSYNTQFIASSRVHQVNYIYNVKHEQSDINVHDIKNGTSKVSRDAKKYHLANPTQYGENCAQISRGNYYYLNPGFQNYYYEASTGKEMADALNTVYMHYDQSHRNGHRNNILNPYFKHVGIAVIYHYSSNQGCIVEDFD